MLHPVLLLFTAKLALLVGGSLPRKAAAGVGLVSRRSAVSWERRCTGCPSRCCGGSSGRPLAHLFVRPRAQPDHCQCNVRHDLARRPQYWPGFMGTAFGNLRRVACWPFASTGMCSPRRGRRQRCAADTDWERGGHSCRREQPPHHDDDRHLLSPLTFRCRSPLGHKRWSRWSARAAAPGSRILPRWRMKHAVCGWGGARGGAGVGTAGALGIGAHWMRFKRRRPVRCWGQRVVHRRGRRRLRALRRHTPKDCGSDLRLCGGHDPELAGLGPVRVGCRGAGQDEFSIACDADHPLCGPALAVSADATHLDVRSQPAGASVESERYHGHHQRRPVFCLASSGRRSRVSYAGKAEPARRRSSASS